MIPYGRQNLDTEDIDAVVKVLRGELLTQGPLVGEFETELASYLGCSRAVVVNSATSALHLGCLALGVGPGDLVWTSAISFVASANAARYCGADVDFVDIDLSTYNMCPRALERKLFETRDNGDQLPKVVIPVAMAGQPADMKRISELSKLYGFRILEDASHALGAEYLGQKVGGCQFSDISVFSFHPVKMITTGEGGVCTTNNLGIARKIERLRSHGITRDFGEMESSDRPAYYYEQLELGFNYRITDFQCALGISQLKKLDSFVDARRRVAKVYDEAISVDWILKPEVFQGGKSSFHLYIIQVLDHGGASRDKVFEYLRADGILANLHYIPIYRHPYYFRTGKYNPQDFPSAEKYYARAISLPIFPGLRLSDVEKTISSLVASGNSTD